MEASEDGKKKAAEQNPSRPGSDGACGMIGVMAGIEPDAEYHQARGCAGEGPQGDSPKGLCSETQISPKDEEIERPEEQDSGELEKRWQSLCALFFKEGFHVLRAGLGNMMGLCQIVHEGCIATHHGGHKEENSNLDEK